MTYYERWLAGEFVSFQLRHFFSCCFILNKKMANVWNLWLTDSWCVLSVGNGRPELESDINSPCAAPSSCLLPCDSFDVHFCLFSTFVLFVFFIWLFDYLALSRLRWLEKKLVSRSQSSHTCLFQSRGTRWQRGKLSGLFSTTFCIFKNFFGKRGSNTPTTFQTNFGCFIFFFFSTFYMFVCYLYKSVSFSRDWLGIL